MPYFTYDTSVFISRRLTSPRDLPKKFLMSAVVLMELVGSPIDESRRKRLEQMLDSISETDR